MQRTTTFRFSGQRTKGRDKWRNRAHLRSWRLGSPVGDYVRRKGKSVRKGVKAVKRLEQSHEWTKISTLTEASKLRGEHTNANDS